ncbi:DUF1573 domain-containing protein [bacterium]|nr:MAG: DUF1573 domain-containing protein [bacterium]
MLANTGTKTVILLVFGIAFITILSLFALSLFSETSTTPITSYAKTDVQKPKAELPVTYIDAGTSKVNDTITRDYVVKNIGDKPLQLSGINSSCDCTSAKIISGNKETKESGMGKRSTEVVEIAPGTEAIIRVIYRPSIMPVYGAVFREVYVNTNDPNLSKIILRIKANIIK